MTSRGRTLAIGGALLAVVVAGLLAGFLALSNNEQPPGIASNSTITPSPTSTDVRAQVEQAYLHHWDVYAQALLTLDGSHLLDVLSGAALRAVQKQLRELKAADQPALVRVEHRYRITIVNEDTAIVDDRYINHTVRLDPTTMEPIEPDPNQSVHKSYTLKKVGGVWKVTDIVLYR
jgi:hypothetical protein